ncbi:serine/threonine-protein phosphatase 7 long form-like protein, partial [Trifolium medium]|nr:serine/threonine-protein phosphatase 7 long form-like protein [Trifolium medium]
ELVTHFTALDDEESYERHRVYALRVYLLLVGYTLFADTSKNCVHLYFVRYFEDLELVSQYAWGASALAFLYNGLSATNLPKTKVITGYMTLLQVTKVVN